MRSPAAVAAMSCPVCRTGLTLSDRAGVEIDYCAQCRGVWLDRGELDKIIASTTPDSTAGWRDGPGYRSDRHRSDYRDQHDDRFRHGKPRKSFLSELFD